MCSTALCLQSSGSNVGENELQSSGSNEGENMDASLQDYTVEEPRGVVRFLWAEGVKLWKFTVVCWLSMDRAP